MSAFTTPKKVKDRSLVRKLDFQSPPHLLPPIRPITPINTPECTPAKLNAIAKEDEVDLTPLLDAAADDFDEEVAEFTEPKKKKRIRVIKFPDVPDGEGAITTTDYDSDEFIGDNAYKVTTCTGDEYIHYGDAQPLDFVKMEPVSSSSKFTEIELDYEDFIFNQFTEEHKKEFLVIKKEFGGVYLLASLFAKIKKLDIKFEKEDVY